MKWFKLYFLIGIVGNCFYYSPEADPYRLEIPYVEGFSEPSVQRVEITIEVFDQATMQTIPDVKLFILGTPLPPYTLKEGKNQIIIPAGRYRFKFSAKNYKDLIKEIAVFQNSSFNFYLEKEEVKE
ncbi:MAG: hypothetical protein ABDH49_06225 [Candidatus Hydrothermales bacterium]